ncbi:MAG: helix-turn-helix transcriptional regulator [Ignavibacteriaceae bacterium]|nr:helix-turn-helix transcriptional regulator [Ignavibacteriaceae bacterium]
MKKKTTAKNKKSSTVRGKKSPVKKATKPTKPKTTLPLSFNPVTYGAVIRELRKQKGLSQDVLAELCGTKTPYISRIENQNKDIRLSNLIRIFKDGFGLKLKLTLTK